MYREKINNLIQTKYENDFLMYKKYVHKYLFKEDV